MSSRLEYYRNLANLSRIDLALLVGVDRTVIWRYEKGMCRPRDRIKIKISNVLGKTVGDIFFSENVALENTKGPTPKP